MQSTLSTYLKRALTVALILGPTLTLVSAEVGARRGGGGGGRGGGFGGGHEVRAPRANVGGGGRDFNRGDYGRRDVNVNRRDVNINRNVDVDVDRHWGYPVGAGAVAVGTAVAVGAIVSSLPTNCTTIVAEGVTYQNCGGTYYAPRYDGPNVVYEVVSPPSSSWSNQ
ncbi:MAG: hypothetical protein P9F19_05680 [Candidatus Contendobacter sp.]|nr:hypothetical protein [Candidatus Contendobacter sp.]MDG4556866.1 hypothetical protein [Candidatus Contendobacter sp.]